MKKLTAQLRAEMEAIEARLGQVKMEILTNLNVVARNQCIVYDENKEFCRLLMKEVNSYKVRLENILCETDIKEQGHLLHSLWNVHRVWHSLCRID